MTDEIATEFDQLFGGKICTHDELENFYRSRNLLFEEIVNSNVDLIDVVGFADAKNFLNGKTVKYVMCEPWENLGDTACIVYTDAKSSCTAQGNSKKEALEELCQMIEWVTQIETQEESIEMYRKKIARILE